MAHETVASGPRPSVAASTVDGSSHSGSQRSDQQFTLSKASTERGAKEKIHLTGVETTLLSMVLFKALETQGVAGEPILNDPYAQQLLDRCDVDFTSSLLPRDPRWVKYVCGRAKLMDKWCQDFLDSHQDEPVTVLHLACGLDLRYLRMEKRGEVRWIDLDRPMVINLREKLVDPLMGDYQMRTLSVLDKGWLKDIPADRRTLIMAEGLFPYLETEEAENTIRKLINYFDHGELIFDVMGSFLARFSKYSLPFRGKGISLKWGVDDVRQMDQLDPKMKLKDSAISTEWLGNELWARSHPPWFGPFTTAMASFSPSYRQNGQIARFEF